MVLEKKAEGTIQLKRFQNEMDPQSPRIIDPMPLDKDAFENAQQPLIFKRK